MNVRGEREVKDKFWKTRISKVEPNKILIRGYNLSHLIGKYSFGDIVYLLFSGELPTGNEGRMIEAILIAGCDHSLAAPSANTVRFVSSSGVPLQASVAAGLISLGDFHGGAIEQCAKMLQENLKTKKKPNIQLLAKNIVAEHRKNKKRVVGYGHPYHSEDPRTQKLIELATRFKIAGPHLLLAKAMENELTKRVRKALPLNVDGAIAAIISDMGLDWRLGKGFYIIARSSGLIAHAYEQIVREKPFKAVPLNKINYDGPKERPLGES